LFLKKVQDLIAIFTSGTFERVQQCLTAVKF